MPFLKYNLPWPDGADALQIEFFCIKKGREWIESQGRTLAFHYNECRRLMWPELDDHRWHRICLEKMCEYKICTLMGCASSGKTHSAAWFGLVDYMVFPNETCVLVSSTTIPGLKKRVWNEMTMLWERAVARYSWLPGNLLDSAIAITTDDLDDSDYDERKVRSMTKGIFGIACVSGGKFVGLSRFIGIKQKRVRLIADEAGAMEISFLSAFANLNNNEDFRAIVLGNPNDIQDPLGKCAEPVGGWSEKYLEPTKTEWWPTRFMNGCCVNLVGQDSPNFDFEGPTRYKYLISKEKIADTLSFFAEDSAEFYAMCKGVMKVGTMSRRVLTREMCEKNGAQTMAVWGDSNQTKCYFVDSGYGGDRCIGGMASFGKDVNGKVILSFGKPKIIPIKVDRDKYGEPEEQISRFVRDDCEANGIPPENMGHDATGRGSLGTALAKEWSAQTNPVESGGAATKRIASLDLLVVDEETKQKRPMRCDEKFDRRVTEYWWCVRYAVEAGQIRDLPDEAMEELCARKWDMVKGNTIISVEPKSGTKTKPGMKERTGKSPDVGDWAAGIVEMARRLGFQISKLANETQVKRDKPDWLTKAAASVQKLHESRLLKS